MLTDFAADWFHPNDRGSRVWADAFWIVLKDLPALSAGPYPCGLGRGSTVTDVGRR